MIKQTVDMSISSSYLAADWPAPANIFAFSTTRFQGSSYGKYDSFNLALHVDDRSENVQLNRQKLVSDLKLDNEPAWLNQIHGNHCIDAEACLGELINADASHTNKPRLVCAVMTADCLPILLTDQKGAWVAACHAGWRGLANGVVENTVNQYPGDTQNLMAWIGPAISRQHFEVGKEVEQQFVANSANSAKFFASNNNGRLQFDFIGLAKQRLIELGVQVFGGDYCTYAQQKQFFSYRRDGQTGRMASLIWIQ